MFNLRDRLAKRRRAKEWQYQKQAIHQVRRFMAANINRLSSAFGSTAVPVDFDLKRDLMIMVSRSRDLAKNSDYVRRFLKMVKNNVVGSEGIKLRAKVMLRNGKAFDKQANDALESGWAEYMRYGVPEVTGKLSGIDCQQLFIESVIRDGEVLIQKHRNFADNEFGYAIEFLDPLLLDPKQEIDSFNGNRVIMGVELNGMRRPVAYHIQGESQNIETHRVGDTMFVRVPARDIMHRHLTEYVYQTRGFPMLVSTLMRLKMLDGFEEAALVSARVAASTMGMFFPNDEDESYQGDAEDSQGVPIMDAEPGKIITMPRGGTYEEFKSNQPTTEHSQFVKAMLRGVASGLGVSYNMLANDLEGVNFSSIRAGVLEDREAWKVLQKWMLDCFMWEWYIDWLQGALLRGVLTFNRPSDGVQVPLKAQEMNRFKRIAWQPRRWPWVDPEKDLKASKIAIDERLVSRSKVMREQGDDPVEMREEIQAEELEMEELGIEVISGASNGQVQESEPDSTETDTE